MRTRFGRQHSLVVWENDAKTNARMPSLDLTYGGGFLPGTRDCVHSNHLQVIVRGGVEIARRRCAL